MVAPLLAACNAIVREVSVQAGGATALGLVGGTGGVAREAQMNQDMPTRMAGITEEAA
jgi:hypothetical protein